MGWEGKERRKGWEREERGKLQFLTPPLLIWTPHFVNPGSAPVQSPVLYRIII